MKKRREPFVVVLLAAGSLLGPMGCVVGPEVSVNPPEPEADAGVHDSSNPPPPDAPAPDAVPDAAVPPDADLVLPDAQVDED